VFGIAAIFTQWPQAEIIVQLLGAAYLMYVAYRIATAPVLADGDFAKHRVPALRDGFVLNLLNPKAYAAFFVLFSQFLLPLQDPTAQFLATSLIVFAVAVIVDSIWLAIGSGIRSIFANPKSARATRVLFALSIVFATLWTLLG
ncbi:MAG: LysE family transporter, partial [Gammaproteobacteria bacterium]|nr:LysE family transporter [Gammaproteobacteria bacterium]